MGNTLDFGERGSLSLFSTVATQMRLAITGAYLFYGKNSYLRMSAVKLSMLYVPCILLLNLVKYQSATSCFFFGSYNGLKQADPSSPLLFMLYINDIVQNLNVGLDQIFTIDYLQLSLILYADDVVVFAKSPEVLQSILYDIE